MSYEQKYLKYKQKYQELKKLLGKNVSELETEKYTEMPDFNLSDTPTGTIDASKMHGGAEVEETDAIEFDLSDTPTGTIVGGSALVAAPYVPSTPLASCVGQVNPMPNVNVPMAQEGGSALVASPYVPSTPLASCAGQVNPMPNVNVPMAMQNKNLINNEDNATEISEIQNTEDIAKLFSQYGGKHKDSSSSESSKSSSTTSSTDSDISTSDSF